MPKPPITILFLGLLLFNWVGYRFVSTCMERLTDRQLVTQLDHDHYDDKQLVSFKIPVLHLAYYNVSALFERVDGQIEIDGIEYKYVKRRLFNDSLELLCIANEAAMVCRQARNDYFRMTSAIADSTKLYQSPDYTAPSLITWNFPCFPIAQHSSYYADSIASAVLTIIDQPPESIG